MKYSITIIGTKPEVTLTIDFKPPKITNDVKIVNTDVVLFKGFDKTKNYSESGIINRKSGELVHEITRDINSETSEKDITFYNCKEINKNI